MSDEEAIVKPTERAWEYLRTLMDNEADYLALRNGDSIVLTGSLGGRYVLYPNGHVVRLDKDAPKLGNISKTSSMPYPDVLATVFMWITKDEAAFRERWECGSLHVVNQEEQAPLIEVGQLIGAGGMIANRAMHDAFRDMAIVERRPWWRRNLGLIIIATISIVPILTIGVFLTNSISAHFPTVVSSNSTVAASSPYTEAINIFIMFAPLLIIGTMMMAIVSVFRRNCG